MAGTKLVEVVVVAPVERSELSSLYRKFAFPPSPPDVHVQVGVASLVGVVAVTEGAVGAVVSMVTAKLPLEDQLPAASRSCTYNVWTAALRAVPGTKLVEVVSVVPVEKSESSSLYR